MNEKIKIDFCGFWDGFNKTENLLSDILKELYEIEISEHPDFLIVSVFGQPFSYTNYDCVRILDTGEPLSPDFSVFDYAIGFDHIDFPDAYGESRYYRYPFCFYHFDRVKKFSGGMPYSEAREALEQKVYFCNFIYGHPSARGEREAIFETLQKYKRVEAAGSFLNNMPEGKAVPFSEKKIDFQRKCKFSIACESICYPGFVTEKIIDPMRAHSVPVYYGNPLVEKEFNPEAMINLGSFSSFEEGIDKVIEADQNDEIYLRMLMAPNFISLIRRRMKRIGVYDFTYRSIMKPAFRSIPGSLTAHSIMRFNSGSTCSTEFKGHSNSLIVKSWEMISTLMKEKSMK